MTKVLIIGGGFAGCASAHMLATISGFDIDLIERSNLLGAGNRTRWYGGHPYTFGPRHFLTPYEHVFRYLNDILPIRLCPEHEFLSYVPQDNEFYAYPINMNDITNLMPDSKLIQEEIKLCKEKITQNGIDAKNLEEYWIQSVGKTLYQKMIEPYNKKMWLVDDVAEIDTFSWSPKGVTIKDGSRAAWDSVYSGYPYDKNGYDKYFEFATKDINVFYNTTLDSIEPGSLKATIGGISREYDYIINTSPVDSLYNYCLGKLPYLGRELDLVVFPGEFILPPNVYFLYFTGQERFTRLVEYKKFTRFSINNTLIGFETPSMNGGKDYPMPFKWSQRKASEYHDLMPKNMFSIGRAGTYLYGVDIDDCIHQAMLIKDTIVTGSWEHPVPGNQYRFPELSPR